MGWLHGVVECTWMGTCTAMIRVNQAETFPSMCMTIINDVYRIHDLGFSKFKRIIIWHNIIMHVQSTVCSSWIYMEWDLCM